MSSSPSAVAAETAGAASAVIGAGSSAPPSGGGGGEQVQDTGALLSDDAILGITSEEAAPASTETPAATTTAPAAAAPGTEAQLTIDDFKPLFGANPKLQSLWDRYDNHNKLVGQFGTVADARKAAETVQILGGVQHLESLATKAASVDQTDAVFFGGRPEERKTLAGEWYDGEGPHEFAVTSKAVADQVDATLGVMAERDTPRFNALQDKLTRQALGAERFDAYLGQLSQALASGQGLEEAVKAILGWGQRLGLDKGKTQPSPDAERISAKERELNQREQSWTEKQTTAAIQSADTQIGTSVRSEISKSLGEMKINGRSVFGPNSTKVRETIEGQIKDSLDQALVKNPVLVAQLNSEKAKGYNVAKLVEITMRHAKLMLPGVIESVVGEWTKSVVSAANGTAERAKNGASRVDVGSGSTSGGSTKPKLTSKEVKEKNMTPEQILDF